MRILVIKQMRIHNTVLKTVCKVCRSCKSRVKRNNVNLRDAPGSTCPLRWARISRKSPDASAWQDQVQLELWTGPLASWDRDTTWWCNISIFKERLVDSSVADPRHLSRIPDPNFLHLDQYQRRKVIFGQKIVTKLRGNIIRVVYPGSGSRFLTNTDQGGQKGTGSWIQGQKDTVENYLGIFVTRHIL